MCNSPMPPYPPLNPQVIDAANGDEKFKTFLEDPTMSKAKKIAGLTAFCDGANFAPITKSFLCVVAENGRLAENQKIYDALEEYTLAAAGQVKATVTSAQPLTPEQLKELTSKLQVHVDAGESLKVETKVDSRLVFAPITKSFLCVVAENGRLAENQKIYDALEEYTLAAAGQVKATVTSAQPLTPEQLKELTSKLQVHVDAGESLKVETKVDSRLVGGFTVAMGEDFFDLSLMSRIRQMEAELAKPIGA